MEIRTFNLMDKGQAREVIARCCAAHRWVDTVVNSKPYENLEALLDTADASWLDMEEYDLLEAFSAHPQIGNVDTLREKFANTKELASGEQAEVQLADEDTITALANANQEYLKKFGFIFIVCATGKSAEQMLELLLTRLPNSREQELQNAAFEQHAITILRLKNIFRTPESTKDNQ